MATTSANAAGIELAVPKITIYPGDSIGADLLTVKRFRERANQLPVIRSPDDAVGKVARRTLIAGKPIPLTYLRDPQVVQQGKAVRIVYAEGPLTISALAIALQSGGVGDLIALRNVDSGSTIRGIAEADGTVRIVAP
ncbi:MAG: flagellar basal body P-ring formation chaperone FlgA [Rhodomicrobiaceae bacterium]